MPSKKPQKTQAPDESRPKKSGRIGYEGEDYPGKHAAVWNPESRGEWDAVVKKTQKWVRTPAVGWQKSYRGTKKKNGRKSKVQKREAGNLERRRGAARQIPRTED